MRLRLLRTFVIPAVVIAAFAPAHGQVPADVSTGVLVGRVVDADAGTPIGGVVVTAVPTSDPDRQAPASVPRSLVTDAQGRFAFRGLPRAVHTVLVSTGGYGYSPSGFIVSGRGHQVGAYLNGGFGQRRPGGAMQTIDLRGSERVIDLVVRLWKGGAITGRVFDEAGEPLVDVAVAAVQRAADGRLLTGPTTRTDDRGMYRLPTLTPGVYVVVVPQTQVLMPTTSDAAPGLRIGSIVSQNAIDGRVTNALAPAARADRFLVYQSTFFPSATTARRATAIALRSGEERTNVDVHLTPVPGVEVSGTVVDAAGPAAGFAVRLLPEDDGDGMSVLEIGSATTDARGGFSFPIVPSGNYTVLALRAAPAPGMPPANGPSAWAAQSISIGGDAVSNLVLTLRAPLQVGGRVTFSGAAARPSGDRLRQFPIALTYARPLLRSGAPMASAPMDASGTFAVQGVVPGRYLFNLREPPGWSLQSITFNGRDLADAAFTIGGDLPDVSIVFTDQPAGIAGTLAGARADEASVFVFPTDRARWPDARVSTRTFRAVRPSRAGAVEVANLIPGEYFLVALGDDDARDWPDESWLTRAASQATTVRVDPGQTTTIVLRMVSLQ